MIDQVVPSQCSTNGLLSVLAKVPAAKQLVTLGHDTPLRLLK